MYYLLVPWQFYYTIYNIKKNIEFTKEMIESLKLNEKDILNNQNVLYLDMLNV